MDPPRDSAQPWEIKWPCGQNSLSWNGFYQTHQDIRSVRSSSCCCYSLAKSLPTLCNPMGCSTPGFPVLHYLPEFAQTHVHWVDDAIQPSLHIRWPKYWNFSISPSNEYSGLIFFRIDWLDLLAVQGTLKNLLQHHSSKASVLQCSAFFIFQLSHLYITTGKTIALTIQMFVAKWCLYFTVWYLVFHGFPSKEQMS